MQIADNNPTDESKETVEVESKDQKSDKQSNNHAGVSETTAQAVHTSEGKLQTDKSERTSLKLENSSTSVNSLNSLTDQDMMTREDRARENQVREDRAREEKKVQMKQEIATNIFSFTGNMLMEIDKGIQSATGQSIVKGINDVTSLLRNEPPTEAIPQDPLQGFREFKQLNKEAEEKQKLIQGARTIPAIPAVSVSVQPNFVNLPFIGPVQIPPKEKLDQIRGSLLMFLFGLLLGIWTRQLKPALINIAKDLVYHTLIIYFLLTYVFRLEKK